MNITPEIRRQQLAEAPQAEAQFLDTMNLINHSNLSYAEKETFGLSFAVMYPLWPHYASQIKQALEAINPAYAGMSKYIISGKVFFANREHSEFTNELYHLRREVWLYVETGTEYAIEYSVTNELSDSITINGQVVWQGNSLQMRELYAIGQEQLLIKLGVVG